MSILRQLYQGNVCPQEYTAPDNDSYREALDELIEICEELEATMTEHQKVLFEAFELASAMVTDLEQEDYFCKGFVLGAQIMREIEAGV